MNDDKICNDSKCKFVRKGIQHNISDHSKLQSEENPIKKILVGLMVICMIIGMILVVHTPPVDDYSSLYIYAGGTLFAIAIGMYFLLKKFQWI